MYKKLTRIAVVSSGILTIGALGMSGGASAATIHLTGPGSRNYVTETRVSSWWQNDKNKVTNSHDTHQTGTHDDVNQWMPPKQKESTNKEYKHEVKHEEAPVYVAAVHHEDAPRVQQTHVSDERQDDWSAWDPVVWHNQGHSYDEWWAGMLQHMATYSSYNWGGDCSNTSWQPSMNGWQSSDWSSWSPMRWQQNGQSYANWYRGMLTHINQSYTTWKNMWDDGRTPRVHTESTTNSTRKTNTNNVEVSNNTNQTARSGNVTVSHNTRAGDARSGDASNQSNTETTIDITNN